MRLGTGGWYGVLVDWKDKRRGAPRSHWRVWQRKKMMALEELSFGSFDELLSCSAYDALLII